MTTYLHTSRAYNTAALTLTKGSTAHNITFEEMSSEVDEYFMSENTILQICW